MAFIRNAIIIFGLCLVAWTIAVSGKAIDNSGPNSSEIPGDGLLPPLIFPTDKQRNNIMPINKTAIKILLHEDDLTNSSSRMTKEADNKETSVELTSGEADDLRKTDQMMAASEEEHAKYEKLHPLPNPNQNNNAAERQGVKDQVENIQEVNVKGDSDELEEQYNRPHPQNIITMNVVNLHKDSTLIRDHLALITVSIVAVLGLSIYIVLLLWRNKLEQRYGNRHRLFTDEDML